MEQKKTKKRKKTILLPLFFSTILLITTSYAWFSANRLVSINTIDVHIQADGGLEVSTDAINWKQVLTVQDIIDANATYPTSINQIPAKIDPVSTGGNVTNGKLELFKGEATNTSSSDFILVANKSEETESHGEESEGSFIAFDIFFRVKNNKDLYLSSKSVINFISDRTPGIENAARIAFLNEGTTTDTPSQAQALSSASSAFIWEPNSDVHTQYGVQNAQTVYGINTTETGGTPLPYYGVIKEIKSSDNVLIQNATTESHPNFFKKVQASLTTPKNNETNNKILELSPNVTKMRIYMWIEGQDVDCEDNTSFGDISYALEFTVNPS